MELNKIIQGDCLEVLKTLPDESVDCVVTSPPYYGLRDYGTAKWEGGKPECNHEVGRGGRGGFTDKQASNTGSVGDEAIKNGEACPKCGAVRIDQQLGLEKTLDEYLNKMLLITNELKRVLKKTGTMWWNHGDSYGGSWADSSNRPENKDSFPRKGHPKENPPQRNVYQKSLLLQNYRLVTKMVDSQGWILRNQIIWYKPNCMPSSVKDRFTVDFEPVFFFSKSKRYWFEPQKDAISESSQKDKRRGRVPSKNAKWDGYQKQTIGKIKSFAYIEDGGRNKRCVWKIATHPFKEAHFATFPEKLITPMIKAGCPPQGIVLDPFMGSGTTAYVARKLGRNYIGIELNGEYIKMAEKRLAQGVLI